MQTIKLGWILSVDRNTASSRLQGYLIHEWMLKNGVSSSILATHSCDLKGVFDSRIYSIAQAILSGGYTHIVFEGPEWSAFQLSMLCKEWGVITLCVRCDYLAAEYDAYFDRVILPTKTLANKLRISRHTIIPDCVEVPLDAHKCDYSLKSQKLQVVWVGHQNYSTYLVDLIMDLKRFKFIAERVQFTIISKGDFATKQWAVETVVEDILNCDIAFIPVPEGEWFAGKSSNRLAMMMSLGMPVIASTLQSYREIATNGEDVLFVETVDQMVAALQQLSGEDARRQMGQKARSTLGVKLSIENIAPQWMKAIEGASNEIIRMPKRSFKVKYLAILLRLRLRLGQLAFVD